MAKLIVANWKMNPESVAAAEKLAKATDTASLVICPPFLFLSNVGRILQKARLGAQDVFWQNSGAFTGEISPLQLKDLSVEYVIVGHSERRQYLGETDYMVAQKLSAVLGAGLTPILCVGETKKQRDSGEQFKIITEQLNIGLSLLTKNLCASKSIIIAYEPVWAIGTGLTDDPDSTLKIISFMKRELLKLNQSCSYHFIYGGSVTSQNVESFLRHQEIEGVLVGGASLNPAELGTIIKIAERYS